MHFHSSEQVLREQLTIANVSHCSMVPAQSPQNSTLHISENEWATPGTCNLWIGVCICTYTYTYTYTCTHHTHKQNFKKIKNPPWATPPFSLESNNMTWKPCVGTEPIWWWWWWWWDVNNDNDDDDDNDITMVNTHYLLYVKHCLRTWKVFVHLIINTTSSKQDHLHFTHEQNKGRELLPVPISPQPGGG